MNQASWNRTIIRFCIAASIVLTATATTVASHPFHISQAEIEYNVKTQSFEVALCMWAEDIETHFQNQSDKPFDFDKLKSDEIDKQLSEYVRARFSIKTANQESSRKSAIQWVGHEMEKQKLWVYFEIPLKDTSQITIENRILINQHPQQVNMMTVKQGKSRESLIATAAKCVFTLQK